MAPAIYGNGLAREYFFKTHCPDDKAEVFAECEKYLKETELSPPNTNFVVSATSLEKKRERYFVFKADDAASESNSTINRRLEELIKTDPRWIPDDSVVFKRDLLSVVFASGSPFPVFPATWVGLPGEGNEWLVDGGFAHNVPIEAANALGAAKALVISSSMLHEHEETIPDTSQEESGQSAAQDESESGKAQRDRKKLLRNTNLLTGNLIRNVPRLFPYLFERSQVEDAVSAEEILVTTISPVHRKKKWPGLTDFKSDVVIDLLDAAKNDKHARIGLVESWGAPVCDFHGISYSCRELKSIRASGPD